LKAFFDRLRTMKVLGISTTFKVIEHLPNLKSMATGAYLDGQRGMWNAFMQSPNVETEKPMMAALEALMGI
jgi:hypothetical protein